VILRKETEQEWLSSTALGTDVLKIILSPYPAEEMIAYPVSSRVNTVTVDEEDLIKPST
jgi:putative SOS response-associated peptidase YedK